ncbi:TlyA family RNA methyltransferase [Alkalicoccus daliensis]|uniref:23S rRNA (Cytidine1920-2'-O)/16S rRNA (Cytidine1409-2'-O)-methyltransferase n=1 Tax=Alkalicoccus daliensis TaxID=745820 RepID=A0A1H0B484_9BACI|nr:TlyA family RNA methyltransferase [Alkalicoccus daliensis]SDN40405.1 23S rRNA (cytidine1920-2'-O)/16S rRNA (cytidine1409-2'-O)-methyltransferase [Alkalicoccus daliensis]
MKKERIDVLLVEQGFFESREKAKRSVMAGLVLADGERVDKAGAKVAIEAELTIKGNAIPYVSRGGLKLERAVKEFKLSLEEKIVLDIGASTGGFTDCALQNGAKLVYALDVGYNQLAWKLRQHEQVVVMERTNFRYCTLEDFPQGRPEFATIDVSFISLKLILPVLKDILTADGEVSALIKPQFEAGREQVGKKGIVRDRKVHESVIEEMITFSELLGFTVQNIIPSPIRGGEGNIEFLMHLQRKGKSNFSIEHIKSLVNTAHASPKI